MHLYSLFLSISISISIYNVYNLGMIPPNRTILPSESWGLPPSNKLFHVFYHHVPLKKWWKKTINRGVTRVYTHASPHILKMFIIIFLHFPHWKCQFFLGWPSGCSTQDVPPTSAPPPRRRRRSLKRHRLSKSPWGHLGFGFRQWMGQRNPKKTPI